MAKGFWRSNILPLSIVIICMIGSAAALPLCIDKTVPKNQSTTLLFCSNSAYSEYGCCDQTKDNELRQILQDMAISDATCSATMKEILCAQCDPYAAQLFGVESTKTSTPSALLYPYLCSKTTNISKSAYCGTVYQTCGSITISGSPFSTNSSFNANAVAIDSVYSSAAQFCNKTQNPSVLTSSNEDYCFDGQPYVLPAPSEVFSPGPDICLDKIATESYVDFVPHPDGSSRAFLTSKVGYIMLVDLPTEGTTETVDETTAPFLNISKLVLSEGEFGLVGLAFHPKFMSNGKFYVSYACDSEADPENCGGYVCPCDLVNSTCSESLLMAHAEDGGFGTGYCRNATVIAEYKVTSANISNATEADVTFSKKILTYGQPFNNHNGGQLHFGPLDGYLYIQFGDGGGEGDPFNFAQSPTVLLGKIVRIDIDNPPIGSKILYGSYGFPPDNPYFSKAQTGLIRGEIFASGFRNPRRCSFDLNRASYFFCGDSGQNSIQEVNLVSNGGNYGWKLYEGTNRFFDAFTNGLYLSPTGNEIPPIITYNESTNINAIGGFLARSTDDACLHGRYLFSDASGTFYAAEENPEGSGRFQNKAKLSAKCATGSPSPCSAIELENTKMDINGWGQDNNAKLYVLSSNGIFRQAKPSRCNSMCTQSIPLFFLQPPPPPSPPSPPSPPPSPPPPQLLSPPDITPATAPESADFVPPPPHTISPSMSPSTSPDIVPSTAPGPEASVDNSTLSSLLTSSLDVSDKTLEGWLIFVGVLSLWILIICGCCVMGYFRYNPKKQLYVLPLVDQRDEEPVVYDGNLGRMPSEYLESEVGEDDGSHNSRGIRRVYSHPQSQDI